MDPIDPKEDAAETMRVLREVYARQVLGNDMMLSEGVSADSEVFKHSVEKLAKSLIEAARSRGFRPFRGSEGARWIDPSATTPAILAMKFYTVLSERPIDFVMFCSYLVEEAQERERGGQSLANEMRSRYGQLVEQIAKASTLRQVRKWLERKDDES